MKGRALEDDEDSTSSSSSRDSVEGPLSDARSEVEKVIVKKGQVLVDVLGADFIEKEIEKEKTMTPSEVRVRSFTFIVPKSILTIQNFRSRRIGMNFKRKGLLGIACGNLPSRILLWPQSRIGHGSMLKLRPYLFALRRVKLQRRVRRNECNFAITLISASAV